MLSTAIGVMIGASRRYDGPMGKSDRAFAFGALALWIATGNELPSDIAYWFPGSIALLLIITIFNRVRKGLQENAHSRTQVLQK